MSGPRAVRLYEALLRLYPRSFRDEYGPDMVLLFSRQLREESAVRVWTRGAVDLAITLPTLHLETSMTRNANPVVPLGFAALSLTGLVLAVLGGASSGMLTAGLALAAVAGALAVLAWRNTRPITTGSSVVAHWRTFLAAGASGLAALVVAVSVVDELPDGMWWPMVITMALALASLSTGLVLGIAHKAAKRPHDVPS